MEQSSFNNLINRITRNESITLDLRKNNLHLLDSAQWKYFCDTLSQSQVKTLHLSRRDLHELTPDKWKSFCDALSQSNVITLDLRVRSRISYAVFIFKRDRHELTSEQRQSLEDILFANKGKQLKDEQSPLRELSVFATQKMIRVGQLDMSKLNHKVLQNELIEALKQSPVRV